MFESNLRGLVMVLNRNAETDWHDVEAAAFTALPGKGAAAG